MDSVCGTMSVFRTVSTQTDTSGGWTDEQTIGRLKNLDFGTVLGTRFFFSIWERVPTRFASSMGAVSRSGDDAIMTASITRHLELDTLIGFQRQHPPPLRPSEQYSTETRIKTPLSYEIPDNTPWRPMVSESTSRVHKTSFGKGFKYHSFADPKPSSGE